MNKWFLGFLSIGVSVLGFHLGSRQIEEKTPRFLVIYFLYSIPASGLPIYGRNTHLKRYR